MKNLFYLSVVILILSPKLAAASVNEPAPLQPPGQTQHLPTQVLPRPKSQPQAPNPSESRSLLSYTGTYGSGETQRTCAQTLEVEFEGTELIGTEACEREPDSSTFVFSCDAERLTCKAVNNIGQDICPTAAIRLLSSGNILLINPCLKEVHSFVRAFLPPQRT